jgi:hypothetical protein
LTGDLRWDPAAATPLAAYGLPVGWETPLLKDLAASMVFDAGQSKRVRDGKLVGYEWEIPWSSKKALRWRTFHDRLDIFCIGVFAKGLPYRDVRKVSDTFAVYDPSWRRMPLYKRIDLKVQLVNEVAGHPVIKRMIAYAEMTNILNFVSSVSKHYDGFRLNAREYYWDQDNRKTPVGLDEFTCNLGLRCDFRIAGRSRGK